MKRLASFPALILIYLSLLTAIVLLAPDALEVGPGELLLAVIGLSLFFSPLLVFVAVVVVWQRRKRVFTAPNATGPLGPDLLAEPDGKPIKARPPRRFTRPAFLGAVMVVCGFGTHFAVNHWILKPVDMPVSLKPGTIRSSEFRLICQGEYGVHLGIQTTSENSYRCPTSPDWEQSSIVKARWILLRDGRPYASHTFNFDNYWSSTPFEAEPGVYAIELQVLSDASCLDKYHPRLVIAAERFSDPEPSLLFDVFSFLGETPLPLLCGASGLAMLVLAMFDHRRTTRRTVGVAGVEHIGPVIYRPEVTRPLGDKFGGMPAFGFYCALVLFVLVVITMTLTGMQPIIEGLWIRTSRQDYARALQNPSVGPLVVSLTIKKKWVHYQINGKEVALDHLEDALKDELSRRAEWVVFVEGDEDLPYQDIVQIMDMANQLHANVVMLTPGMKQGH